MTGDVLTGLPSHRSLLRVLSVFTFTLSLAILYKYNSILFFPDSIESTALGEGRSKNVESFTHQTPHFSAMDRIANVHNGPVVIPEYKLIFLPVPKAACAEWKQLLMRMSNNTRWCRSTELIHRNEINELKRLGNFRLEEVDEMMTSPEWTRAVFVRETKERILSAFLDKVIMEKHYFLTHCCNKIMDEEESQRCRYCNNYEIGSNEYKECTYNPKNFENFLYFITKYRHVCFDVHWEPQIAKIDAKWWPYFNFIGHMENIKDDAKRLLEGLYSSDDPKRQESAWDRFGVSGWGSSDKQCEEREASFLEENISLHLTSSKSKMKYWYTPEAEKLVEEHWDKELIMDQPLFPDVSHFEGTS